MDEQYNNNNTRFLDLASMSNEYDHYAEWNNKNQLIPSTQES